MQQMWIDSTHCQLQGCAAKEAHCNDCKKKVQFPKVCRGSKHVSKVEAVPEVTILNVNSGGSNSIISTVQFSIPGSASQDIELMLDTGSALPILPESVVNDGFQKLSFKNQNSNYGITVGIPSM